MAKAVDLPILVRNPLKRLERKLRKKSFIVPAYHEMKCVFVHIPKNAGTSIKRTLFGQTRITHRLAMDYLPDEPGAYSEYFTFAFSRNPYDRVVSAYHYLIQGGKNDADKLFGEKYLKEYADFSDFVQRGLGQPDVMKYWHFMPQYLFVVDFDGQKIVDFIGRFENIAEDFQYISERIGTCEKLPLLNESSRTDYRLFYTPELADKVWSVYQKDFELFGYSREV